MEHLLTYGSLGYPKAKPMEIMSIDIYDLPQNNLVRFGFSPSYDEGEYYPAYLHLFRQDARELARMILKLTEEETKCQK
jgi:hypothetical protein